VAACDDDGGAGVGRRRQGWASAEAERARAYDAWYETALGAVAHRVELRLIAELAAPERGERALDVGCGTGIYSAWLAEQGLEVSGVDRDPAMLAASRAKAPQVQLVEGDATALPFAEGEFDLGVAVTLFCFLDAWERRAAARELVRVVRPGGRVVVGELARVSLWAAQRRIKGWRGSATWRSAHFTSAGELQALLRDAGATAVHARYCLYLPPWDVPALVRRAEAIERLGRPLGGLGAAFVVVRADLV
jgi:ubiquinone/menaquinone biosynthesis C-methylase UbiE